MQKSLLFTGGSFFAGILLLNANGSEVSFVPNVIRMSTDIEDVLGTSSHEFDHVVWSGVISADGGVGSVIWVKIEVVLGS